LSIKTRTNCLYLSGNKPIVNVEHPLLCGYVRTGKPDNKPDNRMDRFPLTKNSKEFWLRKVYKPLVRGAEVDNYAVRLHYGGKEKRLSLGTPNRELAASIARDWFVYLNANGWAAFLAKYRNPATMSPPQSSSHGAD
jgi:hypothetical protein